MSLSLLHHIALTSFDSVHACALRRLKLKSIIIYFYYYILMFLPSFRDHSEPNAARAIILAIGD
jgi:hypothetical protein